MFVHLSSPRMPPEYYTISGESVPSEMVRLLPWRSTSIDPPSSEIRRLHINDHRSKTRRGARQGTEVEDMHPPGITNDSWTHNCSLTFPYPIEYKGAGVHSSKRFKEHGVHIAAIGKTHQTTLETSSSTKQSFFFRVSTRLVV